MSVVQRRGVRKDAPESAQPLPVHEDSDEKDHTSAAHVEVSRTDYYIMALIFAVAAALRFYRLDHPSGVVFDEVHFGKFAAFYIRREYFFDVHPPLAKLMLAFAAWLSGFNAQFEFENIGDDYVVNNVPYIGIRALPAVLGSLLCSIVYAIMRESGHARLIALFSSALIIFDNAHIAQSRLILLDAQLIFFMSLSLYSYIRFYKLRYREFSSDWWIWLTLSGVSLSLTLSCKMVGLLTFVTIGIPVIFDLWNILDIRRGHPIEYFWKHFIARAVCLIVIPFLIYLFWFWVHFTILTKSGTGDDFMSPRFQESLIGSPLTSSARGLQYYDIIQMKHKQTKTFLHSHPDRYPLKYDDGRISSRGQQVTGYPHNDTNNHWMIVPEKFILPPDGIDVVTLNLTAVPNYENMTITEEGVAKTIGIDSESANSTIDRTVYHGEKIRLFHLNTGSFLITHDVASPLLATNQEFSTWPRGDIAKRYNDTVFKIEIDGVSRKKGLKSKSSQFKLVHVPTRVALWTRPTALPEWAYGQQDINGNKNLNDKSNLWLVEDIISRQGAPVEEPIDANVPKPLNFFSKYFETQIAMLQHNARLTSSHPYASGPINWPFLLSGILFWTGSNTAREQIYMIGNFVSWWLCTMSISVFLGIAIADVTASRRGIELIPQDVKRRLYNSTGFFMIAWMAHYFPFFTMSRQLFLHHYLPAHVASSLIAGSILSFISTETVNAPISYASDRTPKRPRSFIVVTPVMRGAIAVLVSLLIVVFVFFSPLTYGTPGLNVAEVNRRKLLSSWTLYFAK